MKTYFVLLIMGLVACGIAACMQNGPRYSDRQILFAPATKPKATAVAPCDRTANLQQAQRNPACVGQTLASSSGQGGTITILKPGVAMPPADIVADQLPPPGR